MNVSLQRQLGVWLAVCITVAGGSAASLSFGLSYRDAHDDQDGQLAQVAMAFSGRPPLADAAAYQPKDDEDAESHLVVKRLGLRRTAVDPRFDVALSASLPNGLQTLVQQGVGWRVFVHTDATGARYGVAQRTDMRDEAALQNAMLTLVPFVLLIPALLLLVRWVLRRTFVPVAALSAQVDLLDASQSAQLPVADAPLETLTLVRAVNGLLQRLATALDQQRALVSAAAHELRTPLAALMVQVDNVQTSDLSAQAQARMSPVKEGLARLAALLDQLLGYARLQGSPRRPAQTAQLSIIAREVVEAMLPQALAKHIDLGCPRLEPVAVPGEPLDVQAILRNAVDNAVRYTAPGGRVDVSVYCVHAADREAHRACIVVEDSGPGIAAVDRSRVFQPFVRLLGTSEVGSGLGLAIADAAAQALGGSIALGPRLDGASGLRFVYTQPVAAPQLRAG